MKKVLVLGGVSYDGIIHLEEFPKNMPHTIFSHGFHEIIGSTGAGKALSLNRLGFEVSLHGMIGDDFYGKIILEKMQKENINFIHEIDPKGTERHINLMNKRGERISIYACSATFEPEIDISKMEEEIKNSDLIALNIINYCRYYIPLLKKHSKEIWVDLHDYDENNPYHQDFIDAADYVTFSSDSFENYGEFMKKLILDGKKLAVCTHGKNGASALNSEGEWFDIPIIQDFKLKDSNGAGDNFFAGLLYAYSKNCSLKKSLELATIVSGMCINSSELIHDQLNESKLLELWDKYYNKQN